MQEAITKDSLGNHNMHNKIDLDISNNTHHRVNRNVITTILQDLIQHEINLAEAVKAIEHLMIADRVHTLGRTKAGNDISEI